MQCHWRENTRQPFGKHGLACPGRAYQNYIMTSCRSYFHTALYGLLPFDICEIVFQVVEIVVKFFPCIYNCSFEGFSFVKEFYNLLNIINSVYLKIAYNCCLPNILFGKNKTFKPFLFCLDRDWQGTFDGLEASVQGKLAHNNIF